MTRTKHPFAADLFAGQVALITGGGTGLGLATACMLARSGATIAIASRKQANLDAGAAQIRALGATCSTQTCDIRDAEAVRELVKRVLAEHGRLDLLVNNAGGQFPMPAEALAPKGWDSVIRNNLTGTWLMTQAAAVEAMIPARGGVILNVIAEISRGFPGMVHTGAARAGVENMTRTLAVEWATHGIRVNAVAPGVIRTSALSRYGEPLLEARRQEIPFKRLGTADEVAGAVSFLLSPAASYITGETLYVDGGQRLWGRTWPIPEPSTTQEDPS